MLDQTNPQSWNRYGYVSNNPLRYTDPTGHMQASDDSESSNGKCGKGDTSCNWVGKSKPKPPKRKQDDKEDPVVTALHNISTALDTIAWGIDAYNAGVVTYGGIFGAGIGLPFSEGGPEVPVVTGWAGVGIAELSVQPSLQFANYLALGSTILTAVADIRSGDTNIKQGVIAPTTLNSIATTRYGFAVPEAYVSLAVQSVSVSNDLGWTSFPFH